MTKRKSTIFDVKLENLSLKKVENFEYLVREISFPSPQNRRQVSAHAANYMYVFNYLKQVVLW